MILTMDHEDGGWADYDTANTNSGQTITGGAALNGTSFGINSTINTYSSGSSSAKLYTGVNASTNDWRIGFRFDMNTLAQSGSSSARIFYTCDFQATNQIEISLQDAGSGIFIRAEFLEDNTTLDTAVLDTTAEHTYELATSRATGSTAFDGTAEIFVDGVSVTSDTTIDNWNTFTHLRDSAVALRGYYAFSNGSGWSGSWFIDEIVVRDDTTPIFSAPATTSFLWHYNGSAWADVGDSTWTNAVNGLVVKKGDSFNTLLATSGADLELTTDQGATSYTTRDTFSFTPGAIAPLSGASGIDIVAYNGAASGVRVEKSVNAETGTVSTENLTSDHSTTGAGTDISGVA